MKTKRLFTLQHKPVTAKAMAFAHVDSSWSIYTHPKNNFNDEGRNLM
jgi:hypothetical protein